MDRSERLLSQIASSLSTLENYAGSNDTSTMEQMLERIADRLESIHDAAERQIGVLYELREALEGER